MTASVTAITRFILAATTAASARAAFMRSACGRLGFPDQAQQMAWQCIEDARDLGHTFSLAHSLNMGGLTHLLLGDVAACQTVTDELYPLAERNRFPWPLTYAQFQRGWLAAQSGDREAGIRQMLEAAEGAPAAVLQPILLTLAAEQQMLGGAFDAALTTLDRALDLMNTQHNRFYDAEITRMRGEVLLAQSHDNAGRSRDRIQAGDGHRAAAVLPRRWSCAPAYRLARLLADSGRATEARGLLAPLFGAYTEGFAQRDLRAAKALLDELG